jgi:thiol:disulfide interchange protein DsbD
MLSRLIAALLLLAAVAPAARAAESAAVTSPRATVTLISDTDSVAPGTPYHVALRIRMAPGWHTYWQNPGDAGAPPDFTLTLPPGVTASAIAWPAPAPQAEPPLLTYGYSGEVVLPVTVSGGPGPVTAEAHWLVCSNICVPEEGRFRLDLAAGPPSPSAQAPLFAAAEARMPRPSPWAARISPDGVLTVAGEGIGPQSVASAVFMPSEPDRIAAAAPQKMRLAAGRMSLALRPGEKFRPGTGLDGVLLLRDRGGAETALSIAAVPGPAEAATSLAEVLGLAFLGGLILNLMPCVFPVLAMKAVGLARLAGQARSHARAHAASYSAGVLATFIGVGFLLLGLREAGRTVGWGFQFQSPIFVGAMACVLFALGLNLSGVFAFLGPTGAGQALASRGGHQGSFFSGMLAVLVATPCTAPFMGAAITAGLAGSAGATLAVFAALGAGLAAPYAALASIPAFARRLPRPGRWMDVLRQILAFPMYGAVVWLAWVLSLQAGPNGVLAVASALALTGFAAWALGLTQSGTGRRIGRVAAVVAVAAALGVLSSLTVADGAAAAPQAEAGVEPFSAARLAALRAAGKPVFVNMTAAWCVTCLVNERVALGREEVRAAFAERGITYLKGDWTRQDPAITAYLQSQGADGVPLYVFYPAGGGAPVRLGQILTAEAVLAAIR